MTDILGIGDPKEFVPYEIEDGWKVVLPGEEDGRRPLDKLLVAVSRVEIRLQTEEDKEKCLREIEESDRRLRLLQSKPWDWQRVATKGNTVRFGVAWYDRSFFERRKGAWSGEQHASLYKHFGASVDDFTVTHQVFV